jgi:filamentous hemagglutinin family protein
MVKSCQGWGERFGVAAGAMRGAISCGVASLLAFSGNQVLAQVTSDGTLNTQVGADGITYNITGGSPVGTNVFHSFGSFSVPVGGSANFTDVAGFTNIFGRVTGGTPSDIQGTIRAVGSANLFLINPSGIIFGPNARLDIGGSFVGTTANAIRFPGGGEFSMTSPVTPGDTLLAVNPSALFFNQTPAGAIVNQSIAPNSTDPTLKDGLRVPDGQNLFLVGGDVRLENGGTVRALGGRIELGGLAGTGEVKIEELITGSNPNLNFPNVGLTFPDGVTRANVSLTNGAIVDVVALGGGNIAINAQNIDVSGDSFVCAGLGTTASSCGTPSTSFGSSNPKAGNIVIDASGAVNVRQSRIENNVNPGATGNSDNIFDVIASGNFSKLFGSILISTGSLSILDGASVSTSTFGNGNAGLVFVDASDSVTVSGYRGEQRSRIASAVVNGAVGDAGGILIRTGSLSLTDYSLLNSSTAGIGNAGAVVVEADGAVSLVNDSVIFNNVVAGGKGASGLIDITAESLSLLNGSQLQTIARDVQTGSAGSVKINVRDTVTISGLGNPAFGNQGEALPSAIFSSIGSGVTGNAGNIQISTRVLSLSDRGRIDTSLGGLGTAGSIFIKATDSISLANNARIETVIKPGARESRGSSSPFAGNIGSILSGRGGDVTGTILISTGSLSLMDGSVLNTSTLGDGNAGAIAVAASGDVTLKGGVIASLVGQEAIGNAGAILMEVGSLSIASTSTNPAGLTTETNGQGDAGLIYVVADKDISIRGKENGNEVGISTEVAQGSASTGGAIILGARSLFLRDGAKVSVDNQGSGVAGDIVIGTREDIILRDQSSIRALSASGQGGNIFLASGDFLVLVNGSQVSTQVGAGDGGDVTIDTRYIISAPFNDNNISAFAALGTGGAIDITANRLYDIRERVDVLVSNDIDATARSGVDGTVTSNVLNADPTQGLSNLPANPIDPTTLIAETCAPRGGIAERQKNQFIVTGRGGLPPDPNAAFPGEAVVNDLATPEQGEPNNTDEPNSTNPDSPNPVATASPQESGIVEAQSWVYAKNGDIIFTAQAPTKASAPITPNNPMLKPASTCNAF